MNWNVPPLNVRLVIEGKIATTHILERVLREAVGDFGQVDDVLLFDFMPEHLRGKVMPMLVRIGHPHAKPILRWMLRRKIPYIYYIDDNFWELQGETPLAQYYQAAEVRSTLAEAIQGAHTVVVNSSLLGAYLQKKFACIPKVLNAPFDFSLVDHSRKRVPGEGVRIGFAGSASRAKDFVVLLPALQRILDDFPQATLYFFGYCPAELVGRKRVEYIRHVSSYEEFIRLKQSFDLDIGLAPLAPVESNLYKTNNKYREYGALSVAGIYADMQPYQESVRHGETGLLVAHEADAWYEAMAALIRDPALRSAIAEAAYRDVAANYAQTIVAKHWRAVLVDFAREAHIPTLPRSALVWDTLGIRAMGWLARTQLRIHLRLLRVKATLSRAIGLADRREGR